MQTGEHSGEIGTVLYLDDLHLIDPCESVAPFTIIVNYPTCEDNTAMLDAGNGWDEYLWSTGETTQTIVIPVTEPVTVSVTVTDNDTGCEFSDETDLSTPTGCEDIINSIETREPSVEIYPNPASGIFSIELYNAQAGIYAVSIVDITGKILIQRDFVVQNRNLKMQMDLSAYPDGLYLLKLAGNKFTLCERILIR
jgi:hypothetical protein